MGEVLLQGGGARGGKTHFLARSAGDKLAYLSAWASSTVCPERGCRVQGSGCRVQGAGCRVQGSGCRALRDHHPPPPAPAPEREFFIVNLLVRIHFIEMIWWTGLALWEVEFPFSR